VSFAKKPYKRDLYSTKETRILKELIDPMSLTPRAIDTETFAVAKIVSNNDSHA